MELFRLLDATERPPGRSPRLNPSHAETIPTRIHAPFEPRGFGFWALYIPLKTNKLSRPGVDPVCR
jgi:hypothetical protein